MRSLLFVALAALVACAKAPETAPAEEKAKPIEPKVEALRLYVLDCGHIEVSDMSAFDRGGAYDGQSRSMIDTCYLVRHPSGDLVWDAGLPDAINAATEGVVSAEFAMAVPKTMKGQLERLGVPPEAVEFFSISHSHFDHVGNANLFKDATFIVNEAERAHMFGAEAKKDAETFASYADLEAAKKATFTDSYDVFGDGSVRCNTDSTLATLETCPNSTTYFTLCDFRGAAHAKAVGISNTGRISSLDKQPNGSALTCP